MNNNKIDSANNSQATELKPIENARLISLDALRGFTMFWIIGGDRIFRALPDMHDNALFRTLQTQMTHVSWDGFRFYDLIFPMFLFIIGIAVPYAYKRRLEKGARKIDLYFHTFKRAAILFILGLIYYGIKDPNLEWLGYYGVLQRLAIGYFFATIIMLNTNWKGQAIWAGSLLLFFFAIMMFIPVPEYGAGVLTQEGNLNTYWRSIATDLFGIKLARLLSLGMIPTVATALLGILAGQWMRRQISMTEKLKGLLIGGLGLTLAGLLLSIWMPINKPLWNSSYVLFTAGLSCLLLALFYWIIDMKGYKKWSFFFVVIGLNPITIYMLVRVIDFRAIAVFFSQSFIQHFGSAQGFILALMVTGLHWLVVYWLYKNKIFIRI